MMISIVHTMYMVFYGVGMSLTSFVFFYGLGLVCLSKKESFFAFPAFFGAAIFSIVSWYCVQWQVPLYHVFQWMIIYVCAMALCRRINIFKTSGLFWVGAYILLYLLATLFLPEPDTHRYLPIIRLGNMDIFSYINITQHLLLAGPSNLNHISYIDPTWIYYEAPAVYYFHAWMAFLYQNNAMDAAMPTLYAIVSLIGLMITYYCHHFFRCSRFVSLGIAAIVLSGSFYRFIIGHFFLSSLMGTVVWLACLIALLQCYMKKQADYKRVMLVLLIYGSLLFLLYPALWLMNLGIMSGVVGLMLWFNQMHFLKKWILFLLRLLSSVIILGCLFPGYIASVWMNIAEFAARTEIDWGMPLLSPIALLGFPCHFMLTPDSQMMATSIFIVFVIALVYCFHVLFHEKQPAVYVLLFVAMGAFLVYWLYYAIVGDTRYQPWKFASYFVLPMMGVFWAIFYRVLQRSSIFFGLLMLCIGGNFYFCHFATTPLLKKNYQDLSILDTLKEKDVFIRMSHYPASFLPVFYVQHKTLHFLENYSYYYKESLDSLHAYQPYFVESAKGCVFAVPSQKTQEIAHLGCIYWGLPMMQWGKKYRFVDNLPFIEAKNVFAYRWTQGNEAWVKFFMPESTLLAHPTGVIHLEVKPYPSDNRIPQNVHIIWHKHQINTRVTHQQWIEIPYVQTDWSLSKASAFREITLKLLLPDAVSPHQLDFYHTDEHLRALALIQFFII